MRKKVERSRIGEEGANGDKRGNIHNTFNNKDESKKRTVYICYHKRWRNIFACIYINISKRIKNWELWLEDLDEIAFWTTLIYFLMLYSSSDHSENKASENSSFFKSMHSLKLIIRMKCYHPHTLVMSVFWSRSSCTSPTKQKLRIKNKWNRN